MRDTATLSREQRARAHLRRVVITLCVTELTSWGVLYYAFPVLAGEMADSTGWSTGFVTAAFSASLLVAAVAGVPVGRWIDPHGPRQVMTAGSALAAVALVVVAGASTPAWFLLGWVLAGLAMGAVLYPPAFAALTRWHGVDRIRAITWVTVAGGLASTVFAPLTAALSAQLDWRQTYLVLALVLAIVTVPGHWWGLRGHWPSPDLHDHGHAGRPKAPGAVVRSRAYAALLVSASLATFATMAVVIHLVPLLMEQGLRRSAAAVALGLGGVGQVLGRLGYGALARRTSVGGRTTLVLVGVAVTTAALGLVQAALILVGIAVATGMVRGIFTLLQATAVTDRWGPVHYGRLNGMLSAPMTVATAMAPWGGAAIADVLGTYSAAFLVLALVSLAAAVVALASIPASSRTPS